MKTITIKIFMLAYIFILHDYSFGQTPSEIFDAFVQKNYVNLESYFDRSLDLCIEDVQQYNKKDVALKRIKDYLIKNPISKWEPMHQGTSKKSSSNFLIAKVHTSSGIRRLFIYIEKVDSKNIIKEIRIEKI